MKWSGIVLAGLLSLHLSVGDSASLEKCVGGKGDARDTCLKYVLMILKGFPGKVAKGKIESSPNSETSSTERKMPADRTFDKITEMATNVWDFTRDLLDIRDSKITLTDDDLRTQEITRANRHFRRFLLSFLIGVMLKLGAFFPIVVAGLFLLGNTAFVFGKTALFLSGLVAFLRYFYFHSEAVHNSQYKTERVDHVEYYRPEHSNYDFKYNQ